MNRKSILLTILLCVASWAMASPVTGLLERIDKGASKKFIIEQVKSDADFFELDQKGDKVVIRGNNYVSIATGLNWYSSLMERNAGETAGCTSAGDKERTQGNNIALPLRPELLYFLLLYGFLGLEPMGERD